MGRKAIPTREAATKDGLPRRAFAYAPKAEPSTWKLPYLTSDGSPDPDLLPKAAAALSEGGFRGQKADIPTKSLPAVKSRLRSAYRRWKGKDVEYPPSIRESEIREAAAEYGDGMVLREATMLLDRATCPAMVAFLPNGDTVVMPVYTGDFYHASQPYMPADDNGWQSVFNAQDAHDMIGKLLALKNREQDEEQQVATIDAAIAALEKYAKSEGAEVGQPESVTEAHAAVHALLEEAGKRNSTADAKRLKAIHDLLLELGVEDDAADKVTADEPVAEAADIEIEEAGDAAEITFRESAFEGAAVVTLREAAPVFDDATRTVTITPIRPGFGNARDNFYYPSTALQEATEAGMFNHLKMFANHPRKSDEKELPERSVNDWIATTREAQWDAGRGVPRLPVKVHSVDVWEKWKDAPEQIAFSVLGGGYARPGRVNGRDTRIVESFKNLRSVDWVTEAGAGGAIDFAESAAERIDMTDIENLTAEQLREANPALYAELTKMREGDGDGEAAAETGGEAAADTDTGAADTATPAADAATGDAADEGESEGEEAETKEAFVTRAEFERALAAPRVREAGAKIVADELAQSTLPKRVKDIIVSESFSGDAVLFGEGYVYTDDAALRGAVRGEVAKAAKLLGVAPKQSNVTGLGAATGDGAGEVSAREAAQSALDTRWGPESIPQPNANDRTGAGPKDDIESDVAESDSVALSEAGRKASQDLANRFGLL